MPTTNRYSNRCWLPRVYFFDLRFFFTVVFALQRRTEHEAYRVVARYTKRRVHFNSFFLGCAE